MMDVVQLDDRRLNRALLARQLLLERATMSAADAVRQVLAIQAQEPSSPYLALWARLDGVAAEDVDRVFSERSVVKATLMRVTLHAVAADDHPAFREGMQVTLRGARLRDRRFLSSGWSAEDADGVIAPLRAAMTSPMDNDAVQRWLASRAGGDPGPYVWWALRQYGPFVHAPSGGPWSFGRRPLYEPAPGTSSVDPAEAVRTLVRRYLHAFGPATMADFGRFSMLRMPTVGPAFASLDDELVRYGGRGRAPLFDVVDGVLPDADVTAPPRLLPMWDSVLLAHADRTRIIDDPVRSVVIRSNGDVLPTVLVDGRVAGVWRTVSDEVEVRSFAPGGTPWSQDVWDGIESEVCRLAAFAGDRRPIVDDRYSRWWADVPSTGTRRLPLR